MKVRSIWYLVSALTIILESCREDGRDVTKAERIRQQYSGVRAALYKDNEISRDSLKTPYLENMAEILELPKIRKGTKDQIRIWIWGDELSHAITISKMKECYGLRLTSFHSVESDTNFYMVVQFDNILQPVSDCAGFSDSLLKFNVWNLQSGPRMHPGLTSYSIVQFELKKGDLYRYYDYIEPSYYRYVHATAENVYSFLKFLNREAKRELYTPHESAYKENPLSTKTTR